MQAANLILTSLDDELPQHIAQMVVKLAQAAARGTGDPTAVVQPFVELLLDVRGIARQRNDFAEADRIRDALVLAGIEIKDGPEASEWNLRA